MNRTCLVFWIVCGLAAGSQSVSSAEEPYPRVTIHSPRSQIDVLVADGQHGFYRGTRFDATSVVRSWQWQGHRLFLPWKDTHDPTQHDDITGPCEEFRGEPGYADAQPGGSFLKIGVGVCRKPQETTYRFWNRYEVIDRGKWSHRILREGNHRPYGVEQTHEVTSPAGDGYRLTRTVKLTEASGRARLTWQNCLTNRGQRPLTTQVYNHFFLNVDQSRVGPEMRLQLPANLGPPKTQDRFIQIVHQRNGWWIPEKPLDRGSIYAQFPVPVRGPSPYEFRWHHAPTRLELTVRGDQLVSRWDLWGVFRCWCPEPYIDISELAVGADFRWQVELELEKKP